MNVAINGWYAWVGDQALGDGEVRELAECLVSVNTLLSLLFLAMLAAF